MSKKSYVYESLKVFLSTRDDYVVTATPVQLAHLAARAYASGEAGEAVKFTKASLEALKGFLKSKGYQADVSEGDVLGMAVLSTSKSPDSKGQYTVTAEERYLERLVRFGRATKLPAAKTKATTKRTTKTAPAKPASDVEQRIDALESKIDKLLKAFEG